MTSVVGSVDVTFLDNAVWHSLRGRHRSLGVHADGASRYEHDVSPFAAVPDRPDERSWAALRELSERRPAVLFRDHVEIPVGWEEVTRYPGLQFVADGIEGRRCGAAADLGVSDVADMVDLVGRTRPGPFLRRTVELGRYVGIRERGRLIAMAGQRLAPPGFSEISAVCTDPDLRRRGLASALVEHLVALAGERGDRAFLHVAATNGVAISLYQALGFTRRRDLDAVVLRPSEPPS